jgi:hypothetical protein
VSKASNQQEIAHVHKKDDARVFVFGSNRLGIHGGGAAAYAAKELGAHQGIGEGLTGRSYALPTCYSPGIPLALVEVHKHVQRFLSVARGQPEMRFFVSEVGCGIAGFEARDIAPLFRDAPENCDLPPTFVAIIGEATR